MALWLTFSFFKSVFLHSVGEVKPRNVQNSFQAYRIRLSFLYVRIFFPRLCAGAIHRDERENYTSNRTLSFLFIFFSQASQCVILHSITSSVICSKRPLKYFSDCLISWRELDFMESRAFLSFAIIIWSLIKKKMGITKTTRSGRYAVSLLKFLLFLSFYHG